MLTAEEYLSELKADEDQLEELEEEMERASRAWDSTIRAPTMTNFAARLVLFWIIMIFFLFL